MSRDEMLVEFAKLIDAAWEQGWDEGYRRGTEDGASDVA